MTEVQLLIADRDTAASNAATFERANPISGAVATRAAAATVDDARAAAAAAAAAFPAWSALGQTSGARSSCVRLICWRRALPTSSQS